jgi:hypothetical protein
VRNITATNHVIERAAQRNLSPRDITFVLRHGRVLYRTGIQFYFLGRRDIPEELRRESRISRLEGFAVLLSHDGTLITAYKNPKALRKIRRKSKQRFERLAA